MRRALVLLFFFGTAASALSAISAPAEGSAALAQLSFPKPLPDYHDAGAGSVLEILQRRAAEEPFNVIATVIFFLAILHTFFARTFSRIAHRWRDEHQRVIEEEGRRTTMLEVGVI